MREHVDGDPFGAEPFREPRHVVDRRDRDGGVLQRDHPSAVPLDEAVQRAVGQGAEGAARRTRRAVDEEQHPTGGRQPAEVDVAAVGEHAQPVRTRPCLERLHHPVDDVEDEPADAAGQRRLVDEREVVGPVPRERALVRLVQQDSGSSGAYHHGLGDPGRLLQLTLGQGFLERGAGHGATVGDGGERWPRTRCPT